MPLTRSSLSTPLATVACDSTGAFTPTTGSSAAALTSLTCWPASARVVIAVRSSTLRLCSPRRVSVPPTSSHTSKPASPASKVCCFSPLGTLADRARPIRSVISSSFLTGEQLSHDRLDRFLRFFSPNEKAIYVNFIDPYLFFRFLGERCHGNQFWAKLSK